MYRAIGVKILQRGELCYWQGRVSIRAMTKARIALRAIVSTLFAAMLTTFFLDKLFLGKAMRKTDIALKQTMQQAIAGFNASQPNNQLI